MVDRFSERRFVDRYPNVTKTIEKNLLIVDGPIGIDIDNSTQSTFIKAIEGASHELGKVIHRSDLVTYWELVNIARKTGMTEDESLNFALRSWNKDSVFLESPPVPGMQTLLGIFRDIQVPYFFISSRPTKHRDTTVEWFKKTFPWVDPDTIIMERDEGVRGEDYKPDQIRKRGIKLHIEDAPDEAESIAENSPANILLIPQPWNVNHSFRCPKVVTFGYSDEAGAWPIIGFLASPKATEFFSNVAHY